MDQRIYHGNIKPSDFARDLMAHFHQGNLKVQKVGDGNKITVQIATRKNPSSGGQTALSIRLQTVEDGVSVEVGKQAWLGIAASLGVSALYAMRNPMNLLHRLDDIAQDIESLSITEDIWKVLDNTAISLGTGLELSERLKRLECAHCSTANPVGDSNCIACGAPLGSVQPDTCKHCGFVVTHNEKVCPNCKKPT